MLSNNMGRKLRKTKIVCTLALEPKPGEEGFSNTILSEATIESLVRVGMNIARLNMSHGGKDDHATVIERVRRVSRRFETPVGIMVDVRGRKYRTGPTSPGEFALQEGDDFTLTSRDIVGDRTVASVSPPGIHRDAILNGTILVDDGLVRLSVSRIEGTEVHCKVVVGGRLTPGRGVTTPGKAPTQPFPDEDAQQDLLFAARVKSDFVAVSMVNSAEDVQKARDILSENGANPLIISKVETTEALANFDEILEASDSIMVARGDMGVHVPLYRIPVIQKDLIARCNVAGKPVITATQMMESMVRSQMPTRAEVSDVANAIYDGTDAVMLSGETATGWYPVDAVHSMAQTALETEQALRYDDILQSKSQETEQQRTDDAISFTAVRLAHQLDTALILAFTESGSTAGRVSKYRPKSPILALTPYEEVRNRLTLYWGTIPVICTPLASGEDFFRVGQERAREIPGVGKGDTVVLVAGLPMGVQGSTNLLRALTIDG